MKVFVVTIDEKVEPEPGASDVKVFSRAKYAHEHKKFLESQDSMKGKVLKVKYANLLDV